MVLTFNQKFKGLTFVFLKLLPILSFIVAISILYNLDPTSFDYTWKGRTYYLFFVWAIILETILSWDTLKAEDWKLKSLKTVLFTIALILPVLYVFLANYISFNGYTNFNKFIINLAVKCKVGGPTIRDIEYFSGKMPLAIEYLVFTVIFEFIILTEYGIDKLGKYKLSTLLLGLIGFVYLIDNLYPYGAFTPFQIIVPVTASLAAFFLNLMGYRATLKIPENGNVPILNVEGLKGSVGIGWQCSGVDSLTIYSIITLVFLKESSLSREKKIGYFVFGAIITYLINILRIVTIFMIGMTYGLGSKEWWRFHDYYGPLYSITWITAYPLIIIATNTLGGKLKRMLRKRSDC